MSRTAQPVTPGTAPVADLEQAVVEQGVRAEVAETEVETLKRQVSELTSLVHQMNRNQAVATAQPVDLPDLSKVMKSEPKVPVLSKEGWFVPPVHPTDRKAA